jgi:hypothetical protein
MIMKYSFVVIASALLLLSCEYENEHTEIKDVNWQNRAVNTVIRDSLEEGATFLSVYSQIYSQNEHRKHDLTATISMRNTSSRDTIYFDHAEYFDTHGKSIRSYFEKTIYVAPLETVEIVINESHPAGGTGGNFIFDWKKKPETSEPIFDCVMISTSGQQGLSFTTEGKRIK